MARLKSRDKFIPNGFTYYEAATKWRPPHMASFDTVVRMLVSHRLANPYLVKKHNWPTDYDTVAIQVEEYCAALCLSNGWKDFVAATPGGAPQSAAPFIPNRSLQLSANRVVVGASTIAEMMGAEGPVGQEVAERRAAVCAGCRLNDRGDWTRFFTVPAAAAVRSMMSFFGGLKLTTQVDEQLHVCTACACPVKLKVWARLAHILKHMPKTDYDALANECWIKAENGESAAKSGETVLPA
jgi:hypothetical protein